MSHLRTYQLPNELYRDDILTPCQKAQTDADRDEEIYVQTCTMWPASASSFCVAYNLIFSQCL